jgi:drug/metabolite transporter (DMT)-like permease
LGTRFLAATGFFSLIFLKRFSRLRGDYLSRGAIMGVLLFFAYTSQTFGLAGTTPSKNAFLTAAYCVLVPFFYWGISKTRPDRYHIGAAFLLLTGIGFVSLTGDFLISPATGSRCCAPSSTRSAYRLRVHFRKRAGYYSCSPFCSLSPSAYCLGCAAFCLKPRRRACPRKPVVPRLSERYGHRRCPFVSKRGAEIQLARCGLGAPVA